MDAEKKLRQLSDELGFEVTPEMLEELTNGRGECDYDEKPFDERHDSES